jgi:predicted DNA-binding WGR domain protein
MIYSSIHAAASIQHERVIHLQALAPERNVARRYSIALSGDLFGHWIVELRWGRIGTRGQGRRISFPDKGAASRFVRSVLSRRASATRRIGVGYVEIAPCPTRPD